MKLIVNLNIHYKCHRLYIGLKLSEDLQVDA